MPQAVNGLKECCRCGETKTLDKFHKRSNRPDGHEYHCKVCQSKERKKYYQKNKEKEIKKAQEFRNTLKGTAKYLFYSARKRNKEGYKFDITKKWVEEKLKQGKCELTGLEFDYKNKKSKLYSPSIDRINSNKGYTKDNCQIVLWIVNSWKQNGNLNDMEKTAIGFLEKRGYIIKGGVKV